MLRTDLHHPSGFLIPYQPLFLLASKSEYRLFRISLLCIHTNPYT